MLVFAVQMRTGPFGLRGHPPEHRPYCMCGLVWRQTLLQLSCTQLQAVKRVRTGGPGRQRDSE